MRILHVHVHSDLTDFLGNLPAGTRDFKKLIRDLDCQKINCSCNLGRWALKLKWLIQLLWVIWICFWTHGLKLSSPSLILSWGAFWLKNGFLKACLQILRPKCKPAISDWDSTFCRPAWCSATSWKKSPKFLDWWPEKGGVMVKRARTEWLLKFSQLLRPVKPCS